MCESGHSYAITNGKKSTYVIGFDFYKMLPVTLTNKALRNEFMSAITNNEF